MIIKDGAVLISRSLDVYANLALEEWLYMNAKLGQQNKSALLLWRNNPCAVIGRHQNPWTETNTKFLKTIGARVARRNSGGGAVFHDPGNLNLTFFGPRDSHNRRQNLKFVAGVLKAYYDLPAELNDRDDVVVDGRKVSGTAAKLARVESYHHCTLLVNSNAQNLRKALIPTIQNVETKATKSTPSPILNLKDKNVDITVEGLIKKIGHEYNNSVNFEYIDPCEKCFPGFDEIFARFSGWDWIYGRTPEFTLTTNISISPDIFSHKTDEIPVKILVEKGIIQKVSLIIPPGISSSGIHGETTVISSQEGEKFDENTVPALETNILNLLCEKDSFICDFLKRVTQ